MNKLRITILAFITGIILHGCSKILEPISFNIKLDDNIINQQEEFEFVSKGLTFASAKKANENPYPRKVIRPGIGSQANIFNEDDLIKKIIPEPSNDLTYKIGIGDELSFTQINEYTDIDPIWPENSSKKEYLLGAGDILKFVQQNTLNIPDPLSALDPNSKEKDAIIRTEGVVGTDGNVLLLGLGNINAAGRSLSDIRKEVRNIFTRNGLAPNFQLEIGGFNSKKAYLTGMNTESVTKIINLNILPLKLSDIVLQAGISQANKNAAVITLTRNSKDYRITASRLFNPNAPDIYIIDQDEIVIEVFSVETYQKTVSVGSDGNILIPGIGLLMAKDRTIKNLQFEIKQKLLNKGLKPIFQLEIIKFANNEAYFNQGHGSDIIIPLTDKNITLREFIIKYHKHQKSTEKLTIYSLRRNGKEYSFTRDHILNSKNININIFNGDQIEVETLDYKPGQVFALGGSGSAKIINITPSRRETLADILFMKDGALNNVNAKRSEVYLIRGRKPTTAYHLDTQNVSRLLVAANTELRPNDIIYVADRPIISFARTLAEINPLRILLRDIQNNEIP